MANIVATAFMFICGFIFLQMHNIFVSRHNVRLIKNRMQHRNDVSDAAADDGENLRNLAIPQVDKSKVDRKVKQRLDDSTIDFFTAIVDNLEKINASIAGSGPSPGPGPGPGPSPGPGPGVIRGHVGSPQADVIDSDLRDKLDQFKRCLTFNIAGAQAKLVGS
jgi:hypothetical protein